jgi:TRAP transporter TAXI family solute receptor
MADGGGRTVLTLATATPGGGFPLYGGVVADTLNGVDLSLHIETRNTAGSTENILLLDRGEVDLALVQGEVAYEAFSGIGRAPTRATIVSAMYSTAGMFVVRADSVNHTISDLVGQDVVFGARGSGLVLLARYVLDGLNLDIERHFRPIYLDRAGDGPTMVLESKAAALWGGGVGWPGFATVARSPAGARFVTPDADEIARIVDKHPFLRPITIAAGSYPGQTAEIASVGSWSFIMARPDLPEEIGYKLAHALHEAEPALAQRLPQAIETTSANTAIAAPDPLLIHPGVIEYLRRIGELA